MTPTGLGAHGEAINRGIRGDMAANGLLFYAEVDGVVAGPPSSEEMAKLPSIIVAGRAGRRR